jgi:hypothetical protein
MKQWAGVLFAACVLTAGCGSTSPSSPSSTAANTVVFKAHLSPANEVPPVTDVSGSGDATITFNLTRNTAGAIQSGNVDFHVTLSGFASGTIISAAHIHPGVSGTSGAPTIGVTTGLPLTLSSGSGTLDATGIAADVTVLEAIVDNPSAYYFNVHSTTNASGTARGQLVKQ